MTHRSKLFVNSATIGFNMWVQLFAVSRTARKIMICVNDPASASCRGTLARSPHVYIQGRAPSPFSAEGAHLAVLTTHCVPKPFVPYGALIGSVKRLGQ